MHAFPIRSQRKEATLENSPNVATQSALWNGPAGRAWVESQELLDRVFRPFEALLVDAVARDARRVLDVGCGTGSTTLSLARRLGVDGRVTGVDISEPMLAVARARAEAQRPSPVFVLGDAQTYPFEASSFDALCSRFGVMFFDDPVAAFANLRRSAKNDARLHVVVWRDPGDNPFMTAAERAAAPLLPELPARRPDEPGQFAFANPERVRSILEASGWSRVVVEPLDVPCAMPESELTHYVTRMGPLGRALQHADDDTRARVVDAARAALEPYIEGSEVRFVSACWNVRALAQRA
jgi:ubiquinone/menaquinone biosynthesis C-methylase UbiE